MEIHFMLFVLLLFFLYTNLTICSASGRWSLFIENPVHSSFDRDGPPNNALPPGNLDGPPEYSNDAGPPDNALTPGNPAGPPDNALTPGNPVGPPDNPLPPGNHAPPSEPLPGVPDPPTTNPATPYKPLSEEGKGGSSGGMNGGKVAGIVIGTLAGAGLLWCGATVYRKRRSNIRRAQSGAHARTPMVEFVKL